MTNSSSKLAFATVCAAWLLAASSSAAAAEIRLRAQSAPAGSLVLLGDLAQITSGSDEEIQSLAAVELFATPAAGRSRVLTHDELCEILSRGGIDMVKHTVSGASRVAIGSPRPAAKVAKAHITRRGSVRAREMARQAIANYLAATTGDSGPWRVTPELAEAEIQTLDRANEILSVRGGQEPWEGKQSFELVLGDGTIVPVATEVAAAPLVVVAVRPLSRGMTVHEEDVELAAQAEGAREDQGYADVADVVGLEITRSVVAGTVLEEAHLRKPLLVRRGDAVTVYARNSGVRVRAVATAREDGGLDQVITVGSRTDRESFLARVTGYQEVEVFAHAASASPPPAKPARVPRRVVPVSATSVR